MRLIGTFPTEKEAYNFYSFLTKEGIQNIYEWGTHPGSGEKQYRIWVYDENDLEAAQKWFEQYKAHPEDPRFAMPPPPVAVTPPPPAYAEISEKEDLKWQSIPPPRIPIRRASFLLTRLLILICGLLFLWNDKQESQLAQRRGPVAVDFAMTPLQEQLLFDEPAAYRYISELLETVPLQGYKERSQLPEEALQLLRKAEEAPSWQGLVPFLMMAREKGWAAATQAPLFEKIRTGEVWRLFTPCLMHRDFLHILFNMVWVWVLVKQLESRMNRGKLLLLIACIGVISNVAQYLMSGPYFLGFSGVIVGLAAFIWVRQKRAPWEGYALQRSTALFLLFFVLSMCFIEMVSFALQFFSLIQVAPRIANTAHVVGGLTGWVLGHLRFFGRRGT